MKIYVCERCCIYLPLVGWICNRSSIMKTLSLLFGLGLLLFGSHLQAQQRNVLLIIADDFGIDSHGLYNASPGALLPPTPNIDALKNNGVLFQRAYAHPTCSPTRATILTGRHPFRHGVTTAATATDGQLQAGEFTLPRAFASNSGLGYALGMFGKWHLTIGNNTANDPSNVAGWPHYAGCLTGTLVGGSNGTGTYTSWTKTINGVSGAVNGTTTYATTDTTNDAQTWIKARGNSPWFTWVAYNAPHSPFHKPPPGLHTYDTTIPNWSSVAIATNQRLHFNAAIEALDTEIGRLLRPFHATTNTAGIPAAVLANTYVIFIGDNGSPNQVIQAPFSNGHSKDSLFEGGVRVPLIISGPGITSPNRNSSAIVHAADLYATILEMAGINVSSTQPALKPIDSRSLMPILQNQNTGVRYGFAEESGSAQPLNETGRTVRNAAGYKLIRFLDNSERFHDLNTDPDEQTNLLLTTLNSTQLANYTELSGQLGSYTAPANVLGLPLETAWQKRTGAEYARIYTTQTRALAGQSNTTWAPSGAVRNGTQSVPVYAGIESIRVSANWVYVKGSGLPYYTMGPWYFDAAKTQLFVNYPNTWDMLARFPRVPMPAIVRSNTNFGPIAIWASTAIIHNQLDAFYWDGTADIDDTPEGDEFWTRNAYFAEGPTFDPAGAHQPFTGESHHHINPSALRFEMGDHMNYSPSTHTYTEATTPPNHSPILGWSFDGYPIYGPFGYSSPMNAASGVRRMISGFVPRDGATANVDNLNTGGRATLPAWAVRSGHGNSASADSPTGPAVSTAFPIGWYLQDHAYLGDHGYTLGTHFDLDECNGRSCVTPEFPQGTYAYFVTILANGQPAYPYVIGRQYYGVKQGGNWAAQSTVGFNAVDTPNETLYQSGANAALAVTSNTYSSASGGQITLQWSAIEGGSYSVESSTDLSTWTPSQTGLQGNATGLRQTTTAAPGSRRFFRVKLDSTAAYDVLNTP
jgi:arylsulfatase A-like enzyme